MMLWAAIGSLASNLGSLLTLSMLVLPLSFSLLSFLRQQPVHKEHVVPQQTAAAEESEEGREEVRQVRRYGHRATGLGSMQQHHSCETDT